MERVPKIIADGFTTLQLGVNSGLAPSRLPPIQARFSINTTQRGDYPTTRPRWLKRTLLFPEDAEHPDLQTGFQDGAFQHLSNYRPDSGKSSLMLVIGGRVFRVKLAEANTVQEVTIPGDPNPVHFTRGWSVQAELFWLYNDGQSQVFIFDGASARRATGNELKPGTVMAYTQGRVWYSLPNRTSFRAGDLVRSDSGTALYQFRDSVLHETENDFLNEGGDFAVPENSGGIQAMRAFSNIDTSTGQGPLQVFCLNCTFSINAPVDRTIWKDVRYPIQTISQLANGATSQESTINVNGDIFMRSIDGIRSFAVARAQFGQWRNTPQSFEMTEVMQYDQEDLLDHSSAVHFDNRLLTTCSPAYSSHGVFHRGLLALDLSRISLLTAQQQPAWDGLWTGLKILAITTNELGCFAAVLSPTNKIEIWELTTSQGADNDTTPIQCILETRALFAADVFNLKKLHSADLYPENLTDTVSWVIKFRPDAYPCWLDWHSWEDCAEGDTCAQLLNCDPCLCAIQKQYRPKVRLPDPPDKCLEAIGKRSELFF